jgi:hypothetical protein
VYAFDTVVLAEITRQHQEFLRSLAGPRAIHPLERKGRNILGQVLIKAGEWLHAPSPLPHRPAAVSGHVRTNHTGPHASNV